MPKPSPLPEAESASPTASEPGSAPTNASTYTRADARAARIESLAQVERDQLRVMTRAQLHLLGWSHRRIEQEIRVGRWQRVNHGVVATQNAPLTREQLMWLGVLHAGPTSALSHQTACDQAGLLRWESDTIHVITPKGDLVPELTGFFFHQTRRDYHPWIHPAAMPRRLTIEHGALLAAERDESLRRGIGRLAAVVQQRLSTADRLLRESRAISKLRNGRLIRLALVDIAGGAQSFAEIDVARLCADVGLEPPQRQRVRRDRDGRRRYLDCIWILSDGRTLILEVDGSFHLQADNWWRDIKREREIVVAGSVLLRCSSVEIRLEPSGVMLDLARIGVPRTRRYAA